jgi:hypothetical protein
MLASAITAIGLARALAARAAGCQNWTGTQPASPGSASNYLSSVAISSACDAWAVGFQTGGGNTATLTEHWNGSTWTVVPGRRLLRRHREQDPDPALGRPHLDAGGQPGPG